MNGAVARSAAAPPGESARPISTRAGQPAGTGGSCAAAVAGRSTPHMTTSGSRRNDERSGGGGDVSRAGIYRIRAPKVRRKAVLIDHASGGVSTNPSPNVRPPRPSIAVLRRDTGGVRFADAFHVFAIDWTPGR